MYGKLPGACARSVAAAMVFTAVVGASTLASAVGFSGSYQISADKSEPGLVIQTAELADPLNFVLKNAGDVYVVDLFEIWTDETRSPLFQDFRGRRVSFDFIFDTPNLSGTVIGHTRGEGYGTVISGALFFGGRGVLQWRTNQEFAFGDGGVLGVALTQHYFNAGINALPSDGSGFGLTPGREHGATVRATFGLIRAPVAQIPLPAALPLFASALGGLFLFPGRGMRSPAHAPAREPNRPGRS